MASIKGVDYMSAPSVAALKANGVEFVCRYVSTPGNPKNLTRDEAESLKKAGIEIVVVFEMEAERALEGTSAGRTDAISARAQSLACGGPEGSPIYFAIDFDPNPAQMPMIFNYIKGAASVLGKGRTGVYGSYDVVKRVLDARLCGWAWQTDAWSGGRWDVRAPLRQHATRGTVSIGGHPCDLDEAIRPEYGQWIYPKPPLPPKPVEDPIVTVVGPKGGLIVRGRLSKIRGLVPGLVRRFKKITIRE